MKTKHLLFPALALCSLAFISCSKNDSTINNQIDTRVRTYIDAWTGGADTLDLSYDASNRVSQIVQRDGNFTMNFDYTGTSSYVMTMTESGSPTLWEKFMSNGMGLLDSTVQTDTPGDSLTEKYFYNAASQLIEMRSWEYSSGSSTLDEIIQYQYDGNGNKVKEISLDAVGDTMSVMTTTYNSSVPNWYSQGMQFMPVVQKNMPVTNSYYYPSTGATYVENIAYEMDGNNRITKETVTSLGVLNYVTSYIYF